jgi:hypothetical protein
MKNGASWFNYFTFTGSLHSYVKILILKAIQTKNNFTKPFDLQILCVRMSFGGNVPVQYRNTIKIRMLHFWPHD